ncbi:hypothetical protein [Bradyrhizobium iriomotense]|uniref:FUZ/MON1/HPS1 first Longin domain-containing protein n=1 Tax=Bradyrhizobium iriomotense TaxID=441950 RepID=A0ABQ6B7K6_9BRAD|nr:hypothetical protein [Bradyrhizobium iriomotense]GLR90384.1 hypothetical protein GCM10007857_70990 [Bradyrhizobium iriomotense]
MFLKADGTEVWLQSSPSLPYLTLAGVIETSEDYLVVRSRLLQAYKRHHGMVSDDAFLIWDEDGSTLLFCARPDKHCALLLLGEFGQRREKGTASAVLEDLIDIVDRSLSGIARHSGATIRLQVVKPEFAIGTG